MVWFWQRKGFELGNFVAATPAIFLMSQKIKSKVFVFFDNQEIASLYTSCPFIKILGKKPKERPFATSACPTKRHRNESDTMTMCRLLFNATEYPNTYVDKNITTKLNKEPGKKYAAVFHGCLMPHLFKLKDIGQRTRQKIINILKSKNIIPVLLGNKRDFQSYWKNIDISGCINYAGKLSLKDSVSILSQCDFFISNDTGLYHAAGALNMKGLVLWNRTDPMKNRSPCKRISHCINPGGYPEKYKLAIETFLGGK